MSSESLNAFVPFSLDQLTMFLAVVDAGTFARASDRVGRVQSAVSSAVANLERALGTPLFERSGRRSVLTAAGERLATEARLALAQARQVEECAASLRSGIEATLSVVIDTIFPRSVLIDACREFHRTFPTVPLRVQEDTMARALVEDGTADLGICNLAGTSPRGLITRPSRSVQLVPVCSVHHQLATSSPEEIVSALRRSVQIVLSERGPQTQQDVGVLAARTWRVTDLGTKVDLLRSGVGWGSVPVDLVEPELSRGTLIRLHPPQWPDGHLVELHSVVRDTSTLGPAGRWLVSALSQA